VKKTSTLIFGKIIRYMI